MAIPQGLLADPADLAALLGVPSDDVKLVAVLTAASRRFRGAVAPVSFTPVDGAEFRLNGDGTTTVLLPVCPVRAVASVEVDGELLAATEFEWSEQGVLRRRCGWPDRLRSIRVVCDHGYEAVPDDVQEAVLDQAEAAYNTRKGVTAVQVDGQSVSYGAATQIGVTQVWADTVARYRLQGDRA
jgi:hypothetical protein